MDIALYYAPTTCALVSYITLTEANAGFEVRALNFRTQQHFSPDYLKINPKHKVPLLVVDGKTLSENPAIQLWIARQFPQAKLLPSDPWQEVQAISILSWCSSGIHPYLRNINNPAKVCDTPGSVDSVVHHSNEHLQEVFGIADGMLAGREYFFDHFTAADAHFYWCFRRGGQLKVDLSPFKNCQAHFDRIEGRPSTQQLLAFEKQTLENFSKAA
ncbi:MAG: glutathione S-transferase family protein [Beijerinckiaceae bacterium]